MRMYLSSFRMGDHPEHLVALTGGDTRRAVVIANAIDDAPPGVRSAGVELELAALAGLGLDATELDLRDYFGQRDRVRDELAGVSLAWLRGGNVFLLRYALHRSGADAVFGELLADDALVYAGYSAGRASCHRACAASNSWTTPARSPGSTARRRCGTAWRCSARRSCRTTGPPGIRRRPPSIWWWPGTRLRGSPTARSTTGRP